MQTYTFTYLKPNLIYYKNINVKVSTYIASICFLFPQQSAFIFSVIWLMVIPAHKGAALHHLYSRSVLTPPGPWDGSMASHAAMPPPAVRAEPTGRRKQMPITCKLIAGIIEEGARTYAKRLGLWLLWIVHIKPSPYSYCTSTQRYCKPNINVTRLQTYRREQNGIDFPHQVSDTVVENI